MDEDDYSVNFRVFACADRDTHWSYYILYSYRELRMEDR
jgi:hypothetical protein